MWIFGKMHEFLNKINSFCEKLKTLSKGGGGRGVALNIAPAQLWWSLNIE